MTALPLDGLLVADFSRVLAGPLTTMTLADLGARVIKVERPGVGDDTRSWGPPWAAGTSTYFACANRSKESVVLDLADERDRARAHELARRADVLVENFRTGVLDRLGLGYPDVSGTNPGIVYASITGFGSGAGAALPGYDFLVQALGGLMSISGPPGTPSKVGVALVDVLAAKDATTAILAALRARDRSGTGQHLEINLLSSLLGSLANQASSYLAIGEDPVSLGNAHPSIAPYQTLRTRDGLLAVCCGTDGQFQRLCAVIERPTLAEDARFATNADRVAHLAELVAALEARLVEESAATWVRLLTAAGIPAGEVGTVGQGFALAEELGLAPATSPLPGAVPQVRHPVAYSATPPRPPAPPPALGEHTDAVLAWLDDTPADVPDDKEIP